MPKPVVWVFKGDASDLEKALATVQGSVGKTDKAVGGLQAQAKKTAKVMGGALAAGIAAATAAAVALAAQVVKVAGDMDNLAKQARRAGTTAKELDTIRGVFDLAGLSISQTDNLVKKFRVNLGKAADGTAEQADALADLGLKAEDFAGIPLPEKLAMITRGMQGVTDENKRASIATDLFGRSGLDLLPILEGGEQAMRDSAAAVREVGVVSDEAAAQSERLVDQIALTKRMFGSMRRDALEPLIPAFSDVIEAVRATLNELRKTGALTDFGEAAADVFVGVVAPGAAIMANAMVKSLGAINPALNGTIALLKALQAEFFLATFQIKKADAVLHEAAQAWESAAAGVRDLGGAQVDADAKLQDLLVRLDQIRRRLGATKDAAGTTAAGLSGLGAAAAGASGDVQQLSDDLAFLNDPAAQIDLEAMFGGLDLSFLHDAAAQMDLGQFFADDVMSGLEKAQAGFESFQQLWRDGLGQMVNAAGQFAVQVADTLGQMARDTMNERIAAHNETRTQITLIERKLSGALSDQERARLEDVKDQLKERSQAQRDAAIEAFNTQKALALVSAGINTALAVINALATAPNIIAGIVLAALAGAAGGVAIAAIAAEQPPSFHVGSSVLRASDVRGATMDSVLVRAKPGEAVLSTSGVAAAGGADGVDALNAGRQLAAGIVANIIRFGTRTTEVISHQQLRSRTGRMQQEFRSVRPRVGRSIPGRR